MSTKELSERASGALEEIIKLMGYDFAVEAEDKDGRVQLNIVGDEEGALIGPRGQVLESLQFLLGLILSREERTKRPVVLENGGFRARRDEALVELAGKLKAAVLQEGQAVALNPMSSHDRRIIHMTLKGDDEVSTESEGDGDQRRVLVIPKS